MVNAIEGSAALARSVPPSARQPSPNRRFPASLPALLAVPEPAQPARLGVAIKEPPPVRLIGTLVPLSIPRPEGKMTPTASKP